MSQRLYSIGFGSTLSSQHKKKNTWSHLMIKHRMSCRNNFLTQLLITVLPLSFLQKCISIPETVRYNTQKPWPCHAGCSHRRWRVPAHVRAFAFSLHGKIWIVCEYECVTVHTHAHTHKMALHVRASRGLTVTRVRASHAEFTERQVRENIYIHMCAVHLCVRTNNSRIERRRAFVHRCVCEWNMWCTQKKYGKRMLSIQCI